MKHTPTVAVVFGSRSTEHDISILTALSSVIKPLEMSGKYRVLPVYIAKDGTWYADEAFKDIRFFRDGDVAAKLQKRTPAMLSFAHGLQLVVPSAVRTKRYAIDVVFPATHGTHGEDGELMAICEMANVPYVGCDVSASVVAMDKVLAKQVAQAAGIATSPFVSFYKDTYEADPDTWVQRIETALRYPLFVKPAHLGSSIGISKVTTATELRNAIEVALHYDQKALVEEAVAHLTEVTLPIMGNSEPVLAMLEEPLTTSEDFFDFDTKYMRGGKAKGAKGVGGKVSGAQGYSRIPAKVSAELAAQARETGLAVYKALGCSGTARVDMLINTATNTVYFNEVNPLPGSLYAHNWAQAGVSNVELVTTLITYAMERHQSRIKVATSFGSSFLQQF